MSGLRRVSSWRRTASLAALALGCASTPPPPVPVVPSWERGSEGLQIDDQERALQEKADRAIAELETEDLIIADAALDALIAEVLKKLTPALDDGAPTLRVRVVKSVERNASALPNGALLVSVGLLAALDHEAHLAALLGHELAHVVFRHSLVSREYEDITPSTVYRMKLSRDLEWSADVHSLEWMSQAGYPPAAAYRLLGFMDANPVPDRERVFAWESHPDVAARRRRIAELAAEMGFEGSREIDVARYEDAIAGVLLPTAELEIEAGDYDRASRAIDRYLASFPDSGRAYYLKGEVFRHRLPGGRSSLVTRDAYERAVQLAPDDPDALRALGFVLREAGETERARELLERYLVVAPDALDKELIERYVGEK